MKDVENMLTTLYLMYKNSSKKWREIKELFSALKDEYEFNDNSLRPKKAYGTRWLDHRVSAMNTVFDKYGVFLAHIENLISTSKVSKERATLEGHCRKFVKASVVLHLGIFLDILTPMRDLSLCLQKNNITVVDAADLLESTLKIYDTLEKKLVENPDFMYQLGYFKTVRNLEQDKSYQKALICYTLTRPSNPFRQTLNICAQYNSVHE